MTLGFRGEALNALCAISSVKIFTRAADSELGSLLTFDYQGNISGQTPAAREKGTTIHVEGLFETLPVRRKEFERSAKREVIKMLLTIQSFALLCPQIKFLCTNLVGGKKLSLICTSGRNSGIRDVITNLFGSSKSSPLVEIREDSPSEDILSFYSIPLREQHLNDLFKLRGFVSSCEHGNGRSSSDRQFVYINNRPVEFSRVCSIVNDVYKQFNKSQYPIIVLFIDVPLDKIDVNVTPDKKTVILEKENYLFACIKASVLKTMLNIVGAHSTINSSVEDKRKMMPSDAAWAPVDSFYDNEINATISSQNSSHDFQNDENKSMMNVAELLRHRKHTKVSPPSKKQCTIKKSDSLSAFRTAGFIPSSNPQTRQNIENCCVNAKQMEEDTFAQNFKVHVHSFDDVKILKETAHTNVSISYSQDTEMARTQQKVKFSMKVLQEAYFKTNIIDKKPAENQKDSTDVLDEFTASISKENDSESERQLSRSLRKRDFLEMEVIGQFNKGFIICNIRSHLFIVDQHASDEKYNFEKLQKRAKLTKQPLLTPVPLSFGTVQEIVIRENLQVFQANGFDFDFRLNDGCLKTFLTARPEIIGQHLNHNDIEEILAAVSEYPNQMYRPIRIRNVFASRACRKSVMIGKPLDYREMKRIIKHLATLDQPWNCPHGRPTIRHLASLKHRSAMFDTVNVL